MSIPSHIAAAYAAGSKTLALGLRLVRQDGIAYGFTSHDRDVEIGGLVYRAFPGLGRSDVDMSAAWNADNFDFIVLEDVSVFTRADVLADRWSGAVLSPFVYDWTNPSAGVYWMPEGQLAKAEVLDGHFKFEFFSFETLLQQERGLVVQRDCPYEFGDDRCRFDLGPVTVTGALTSVTGNRIVADSARTEADDWFGEGIITMLDGPAVGQRRKVKAYTEAGGIVELSIPWIILPQAGDSYQLVPGCRKRKLEDCRDKWDNILWFGGCEPPGQDFLTRPPA